MTETAYSYTISTDFPGGLVNETKLKNEIDSSSISIALDRIDTEGDIIYIIFVDALTTGDKTILDNDTTGPAGGLIAAHDNSPILITNFTETIYPRTDNHNKNVWKRMIKYTLNGTIRKLNEIKLMSYIDDGATSYDVKIYDDTNDNTIAEKNFTNTTEELQNMGTLSNIPTNIANIEVQLKKNGGNKSNKAYLDYVTLYIS